jgi:hypothetical protein
MVNNELQVPTSVGNYLMVHGDSISRLCEHVEMISELKIIPASNKFELFETNYYPNALHLLVLQTITNGFKTFSAMINLSNYLIMPEIELILKHCLDILVHDRPYHEIKALTETKSATKNTSNSDTKNTSNSNAKSEEKSDTSIHKFVAPGEKVLELLDGKWVQLVNANTWGGVSRLPYTDDSSNINRVLSYGTTREDILAISEMTYGKKINSMALGSPFYHMHEPYKPILGNFESPEYAFLAKVNAHSVTIYDTEGHNSEDICYYLSLNPNIKNVTIWKSAITVKCCRLLAKSRTIEYMSLNVLTDPAGCCNELITSKSLRNLDLFGNPVSKKSLGILLGSERIGRLHTFGGYLDRPQFEWLCSAAKFIWTFNGCKVPVSDISVEKLEEYNDKLKKLPLNIVEYDLTTNMRGSF